VDHLVPKNDEFALQHHLSRRRKVNHGMALGSADLDCSGIDNIVFISILAGRLPRNSQNRARQWGLALAMLMRVLLLLSLSWIMGLTRSLFSIANVDVTGRSLILIGGGLFLLVKSTREIHNKLENVDKHAGPALRP
jgi:predicted tellurium resistance membrane protein TerC